jgi:hypothetical protein
MRDARRMLPFVNQRPKQAKQGFIVCCWGHPLRLHEKIMALPWFHL